MRWEWLKIEIRQARDALQILALARDEYKSLARAMDGWKAKAA